MPSTRKKNSSAVTRFTLGLAGKLGGGLFIAGIVGLVTEYFVNNPAGMLVFAAIGFAGLLITTIGLVGDEF